METIIAIDIGDKARIDDRLQTYRAYAELELSCVCDFGRCKIITNNLLISFVDLTEISVAVSEKSAD